MMIAFLIAGIGLLLAGLLTVVLGIQIDLSFGNTLILTGAVVACTGTMVMGLWALLRELKNIARQLSPEFRSAAAGEAHKEPSVDRSRPPAAPQPWQAEDFYRDRARSDLPGAPEPVDPAPAPKPRRNLFSSSLRKERERTEVKMEEGARIDSNELAPVMLQGAWPKPERMRAADPKPPRRSGRTPSIIAETDGSAQDFETHGFAVPAEDPPPVTVLKSGIVDGMAYSLYSDGSIEAQMPEGLMRFISIEELRAHLDQRP